MENRFVDLETKVSYLEYHLEELSQTVAQQQKEISQLQTQLAALVKHIQTSNGPSL